MTSLASHSDDRTTERIPIFTIGYGAREIDEFVDLLHRHDIAYLIDIRSAPYSRYKPEFSKAALEERLGRDDIRYVFMGDKLGGRPTGDDWYTNGEVDYAKLANAPFYHAGIQRLQRAFEQQQRVAIMCSEGKPEQCHRSKLIGMTLDELAIPVVHIDEKDELKSQDEVIDRLAEPEASGPEQPSFFDDLPLPEMEPPPDFLPEEPPYLDEAPFEPSLAIQSAQLDLPKNRFTADSLPEDPNAKAREVLKSVFGYDDFWPLQDESISNILAGRDTLVIMPTGGGKSICYQLPALILPGMTIVVSPLISLMQDQVTQLRDLGIAAAFLNSTLTHQAQSQLMQAARRGEVKLLYLAPETLLKPEIQGLLDECHVDCLAIDEAHCISSWGHDFRPEYRQLRTVRDRLSHATCVALTATATPRVQSDIREILGFSEANSFIGSFNRTNLHLSAQPRVDGLAQLLDFLSEHRDQSGIIYCSTRKDVDGLAERLQAHGWSALPYHAGLDAGTRRRHQEEWVRDNVQIMTATIAFGMGIDKSNVRFVAHYSLPQSVENYYQEIGRSGRDGLRADCLLLYSVSDTVTQRHFIDTGAESERAGRSARLQAMWRYAETRSCRRPPLLDYFGEVFQDPCDFCDNCQQNPDEMEQNDVTEAAQKFLSCVARTRQIFGITHIVNVLRGSQAQSVLSRGHDKLSTYGIGAEYSAREWKALAQQFISQGLLEQDMEHGSLRLTSKAQAVFQGEPVLVTARPAPSIVQSDITHDIELFTQLRGLRKELADQANLPAYIVFSDRALVEMATYFPQDETQLLSINGVGGAKLERYGEPFLALLQDYCSRHNLKPRAKGAEALTAHRPTSLAKRRFEEVGERFQAGESIEQLRASYDVKQSTIIGHLAKYQHAGHDIDGERVLAASSLTTEAQAPVFTAFAELGPEYLSSVYESLRGSVEYEELHLLRIVFNDKHASL